MKHWFFLILFLTSIFSAQPIIAEDGKWQDQWEEIKKDYEEAVGESRPREKFLSIVKTSSIKPSLQKLDRLYAELIDLEGKTFRKKFNTFKKTFKKFESKKDKYLNFLEDDQMSKSVSGAHKKAAKKLQKETDELEKEIRKFKDEIDKDKLENVVIKFDLITCDEETISLIEPDGFITIRLTLSDEAMKKYQRTIKKLIEKQLEVVRLKLENKLIELDNKFLDEIVDLLENEKIQATSEEHRLSAEEEWAKAKLEAYAEIEDIANQEWIKIRKAKVRYLKYKIDVGKSIAKKVMALGSGIARLAASNGGDILAYIAIAKTAVNLAIEIKGLLDSPEEVSAELVSDIEKYNQLHEELRQKQDPVKQLLLAKQESDIREEITTLKNKTAGLAEKASKLGVKIDELEIAITEMENIEDLENLEKLQKKIIAAGEKVKTLDIEHDKLINRLGEAEEVIETAEQDYDKQEPALLLRVKEKLEDAYDKAQKIKSIGTKIFDLASTLGVF